MAQNGSQGSIFVFSAPSGAGKTTLLDYLRQKMIRPYMQPVLPLAFDCNAGSDNFRKPVNVISLHIPHRFNLSSHTLTPRLCAEKSDSYCRPCQVYPEFTRFLRHINSIRGGAGYNSRSEVFHNLQLSFSASCGNRYNG